MSSAIHTSHTYLMVGSGTSSITYSKLVDVIEIPDLWKSPNTIDTTTLSDNIKTYINGLVDPGNLEFSANYTTANWAALDAVDGTAGKQFSVWIGANSSGEPDGTKGKFDFTGELSFGLKGAGVDDKHVIGISIAVSSDITATVPSN